MVCFLDWDDRGRFNFTPDRSAIVVDTREGRVSRMFVTVGDEVKRGDPLVEIESNELGDALATLVMAAAVWAAKSTATTPAYLDIPTSSLNQASSRAWADER